MTARLRCGEDVGGQFADETGQDLLGLGPERVEFLGPSGLRQVRALATPTACLLAGPPERSIAS
jgi:hypothetical protein